MKSVDEEDKDKDKEPTERFVRLPGGHVVAGRYTITRVVGEGAQGVVYEAQRTDATGRVAIKVLHRHLCGSEVIQRRFEREARILARLDGEHLVKQLDYLEEDGLLMLALEYIDGTSLEARLAEPRPLPIKEAVEIALQICAALGAAHAAGIIHRDLKPANVLLERPEPEPDSEPAPRPGRPRVPPNVLPDSVRVRVVDFGVARVLAGEGMTTNLTAQGMIFGTPEYMAPEQARGDGADARSDIYAAGVILYEMTVGRTPFHARSAVATMAAHLTEAPIPPRAARPGGKISSALEAVILRALAKDPAERYPDARAFAEALDAASSEHRVIAVPSSPIGPIDPIDPELAAIGDTDLHVDAPALGIAKTQLSLARPEAIDAPLAMPVVPPTILAPTRAGDPPARSPWLWAAVAIVAAAIGIFLGAFIGAR
jgi:eukaryotic-like serine/threonine-protein kinase